MFITVKCDFVYFISVPFFYGKNQGKFLLLFIVNFYFRLADTYFNIAFLHIFAANLLDINLKKLLFELAASGEP